MYVNKGSRTRKMGAWDGRDAASCVQRKYLSLFMAGLNVPPPCGLRAGLLGLRVVAPHPQGLQGPHLKTSH